MQIYHNPRCQKSRLSLALLQENGVEPTIRLYLEEVPTEKELKAVLKKLKMKAADLVRKSEKIFKEQFKGRELSEQEWVEAMIEYPKLIERPIVLSGSRAVIGRPPEDVLQLL